MKAAFLEKFIRLVEWPVSAFSSDHAPLIIGILGEDPFESYLPRVMRGKTINKHPIQVLVCKTLEEANRTHLLFISPSEKNRLAEILPRLKSQGLLTVGDVEGFASSGGIINLYLEDQKIRFEINVDVARQAGLEINAQLLQRAKVIHDSGSGRK
ncbi:MAG: YfiR family protein [Verrucomicrobiota bacterium]